MNVIDIVILVIVFASILLAFLKGFVQQAISLAGWVIALLAARLLGSQLAPMFDSLLVDPKYQLIAAYIVITLVVLLATKVISSAFGTLVQKIGLGYLDRLLGVIFGGLRGVIIVVLLVAVFSLTGLKDTVVWQESFLMPYMEQVRDWTAGQYDDYSKK